MPEAPAERHPNLAKPADETARHASQPTATDDHGGASHSKLPDPKRWLALAVIAVAQLMVVLDASIVNIALPSAQTALDISDANRQWVVTAYTLTFGGLLLLGGRIADYAGRKRMFVLGLIGFGVASGLGGIAQNSLELFGARAVQGAFAALLAPAALSLINVMFTDHKERARAFGVYGAVSGGGAALGLILGGVLTDYASWRWCLLVNVPIAVVTALFALPLVRESRARGNTIYDIPGALLVTAGLVSLVFAFSEAAKPGVGWTANLTLSFLGLAAVLIAGFLWVEARAANPLLPLRILLERNRGGAYIASTLVGAALYSMFLFLTYYYQLNLGYSPLKAGFAYLPFSAGVIVGSGLASTVMTRTAPKLVMSAGGVVATAGMLYLLTISDTTSWAAHVLPSELMLSLGLGLLFVPLSSVGLSGVDGHDAGVASALVNTGQQVGASLGTALLNTIYAGAVSSYISSHVSARTPLASVEPLAFISGYHHAFFIGSCFLAATTVVVLVLINVSHKHVAQQSKVVVG